jgi:hypothetical protein
LASLIASGAPSCTLIFLHPETCHGLTNDGIPQVNIDQLNPKTLFLGFSLPDILVNQQCGHVAYDGDVYNFTSLAMQLTQGKLLKTVDWSQWQQSEFTMLDQYKPQGLFGKPVKVDNNEAVFNLVWTYVVKELDKHEKARCIRVVRFASWITHMQIVLIKQDVESFLQSQLWTSSLYIV